MKSTVQQIRERFDKDVERFSNLETGQSAVVDSPLCMDLVASAAVAVTPHARDLLDIGCGAGNYTLKVLEKLTQAQPNRNPSATSTPLSALNCALIDLSLPMLTRAVERISAATRGTIRPLQGDMRDIPLAPNSFDIVVTSAALHHLRTDAEWLALFTKIHAALRPGGSFWIFDLIEHVHPAVEKLMRDRYGEYLANLKGGGPAGSAYRDHVFAYIAQEDTPKPLIYQLDLLRQVGFRDVDVLHKTAMGAAFGAVK